MADLFGFMATLCIMSSYGSQILKTIKFGDTRGISVFMIMFSISGNAFWLINGLITENLALTISASIMILIVLPLLFLKLKNDVIKKLQFS